MFVRTYVHTYLCRTPPAFDGTVDGYTLSQDREQWVNAGDTWVAPTVKCFQGPQYRRIYVPAQAYGGGPFVSLNYI